MSNSVKAGTLAGGRPFLDGLAIPWITNTDLGADNVHPTASSHMKIARGL